MLPSSGPLSITDVLIEFGGVPAGPLDLSDLYRGAASGRVREKAADAHPNVVNKAQAVPTSGPFDLASFYGAERAFEYTNPGYGTIQGFSGVFASDWSVDYPKRYINAGIQARLQVEAGGVGQITLINNGEIQGLGGAPNGGAGASALYAYSDVTIENNGAIRGGGGGGGKGGNGGTGGQGYYYSTVQEGPIFDPVNSYWLLDFSAGSLSIRWQGTWVLWNSTEHFLVTSYSSGGYTYYPGPNQSVYRTYQQTNYTSGGAGGAGGNGGYGQGYGQTATGGSAGAAGANGGTNAGKGGYGGGGGNGGDWGLAGDPGATGQTGYSGNYTAGSAGAAGSAGGAAGWAVEKGAGVTVTFTKLGTINGAY